MAKTRKVMDINEHGKHYSIVHDNVKDLYCVYWHSWSMDENRILHQRKSLFGKYYTISSALFDVAAQY